MSWPKSEETSGGLVWVSLIVPFVPVNPAGKMLAALKFYIAKGSKFEAEKK